MTLMKQICAKICILSAQMFAEIYIYRSLHIIFLHKSLPIEKNVVDSTRTDLIKSFHKTNSVTLVEIHFSYWPFTKQYTSAWAINKPVFMAKT